MGLWLLAAIAAPLCWGFTNVFDAFLRRTYVKSELTLLWLMTALRFPIAIIMFIYLGLNFEWNLNALYMVFAGLLFTIPAFFYFKAAEYEDPSNMALYMQIIPALTLILASILINESLNASQFVAFLLILVGGSLAGIRRFQKKWHFSVGFLLIIFASVIWAFSDVLFKVFEPGFQNFWFAFAVYFFGGSLLAFFILLQPKNRHKIFRDIKMVPKNMWKIIVFDNLMGVLGSLAFAYALAIGKASLTSVMIGLQPLFAFILGLLLSKFIKDLTKEALDKNSLILKCTSLLFIIVGLLYLNL